MIVVAFKCSCGFTLGTEANFMEVKTGLCKRCREKANFTNCGVCNYTAISPGGKGYKDCRYCQRDLGEPVAIVVATKAGAPVAAVSSLLPEDWRVWRDHGLPKDYCPCGVSKTICDYHREGA